MIFIVVYVTPRKRHIKKMRPSIVRRVFDHGACIARGIASFTACTRSVMVTSLGAGAEVRCMSAAAGHRALLGYEYSPQTVRFRIATLDDVDSINDCNRVSLPENYPREFFQEYILRWREVCLVAEGSSAGIVGYCLGRIEDFTTPGRREMFLSSIAVQPQFRGRKIGESLMQKLHSNMIRCYEATHVSLHCRPSNQGALKLYRRLNYCERQILPQYYEDGEAALLLTKDLTIRGVAKPVSRHDYIAAPN
jgi:ribosomal protein S18 acetylase RimI-like enzyme